MQNRKKLIAGIILGILLLGTVGGLIYVKAQTKKDEPEQVTLRYAAPLTIAAAPIYVADAKNFWTEEGAEVDVTYFDSGRKALDALLANSAEVMSVSETPPLRAYLAGSKISIIATATEHKEAKMTVRSDRIYKPEDVRGKKIGSVAGTNSDYYMYRWLEANDISTSEVDIVALDAAALSQAFVQGDIDVMFAWEPHNFNAASKIADKAVSWPTEEYTGRHTIVMNEEFLENNGVAAERIIKGLIKAEEYIKNNPEDAKAIVRDKTGMSETALNNLWDEYTYKVGLDDELLIIIGNETNWMKMSEDNRSTLDPKQLVNSSFLFNIDSDRVGGKFKS